MTQSSAPNTGPWLVLAAALALCGVIVTQIVQGRLARRANKLTQDSIDATRDIAEHSMRRAESDAARADEASLAQRYQEAAAQLGHESAAVRLAGVHAMAKLADDWDLQRSTCVEVLSAYVRLPITTMIDGRDDPAELQVRRTLYGLFQSHLELAANSATAWSSIKINFSDARLVDFQLNECRFNKGVEFTRTTFAGSCSVLALHVEESATFTDCLIEGSLVLGPSHGKSATFVRAARVVREAVLVIRTGNDIANLLMANLLYDSSIEGRLVIEVAPVANDQVSLHLTGLELHPGSQTRVQIEASSGSIVLPDVDATWPEVIADKWRVHAEADLWVAPALASVFRWAPTKSHDTAIVRIPDELSLAEIRDLRDHARDVSKILGLYVKVDEWT